MDATQGKTRYMKHVSMSLVTGVVYPQPGRQRWCIGTCGLDSQSKDSRRRCECKSRVMRRTTRRTVCVDSFAQPRPRLGSRSEGHGMRPAWQDMELASPYREEPVTQIDADVPIAPISLQAEHVDLELDLHSYERPLAVSPFGTRKARRSLANHAHPKPNSRMSCVSMVSSRTHCSAVGTSISFKLHLTSPERLTYVALDGSCGWTRKRHVWPTFLLGGIPWLSRLLSEHHWAYSCLNPLERTIQTLDCSLVVDLETCLGS